MGLMLDGAYLADDDPTATGPDGQFRRALSSVRNPFPDGPHAPGRFHLYAAWNCPWAHRVLLLRALKGLEAQITVAYARPRRTKDGWIYDADGAHADPLFGVSALHQAYARVQPPYSGRITVPLLWDRQTNCAISNESAELLRQLNTAFPQGPDLAPRELIDQIDRWNEQIYPKLNNGVYRAGFARTQAAYEDGCRDVFDMLDTIEAQLAQTRYLCGDRFTEADLRLFPTLARFDVAYHYAFRCNIRRLVDYPNLWAYAREIYQMPGVACTVRFDIYKQGYFSPSEARNPLGIVPLGPEIDWSGPHGRG